MIYMNIYFIWRIRVNNLNEWAKQQVLGMPYEDSILLIRTAKDWHLSDEHIKALIDAIKPEDKDQFNKQYGFDQ